MKALKAAPFKKTFLDFLDIFCLFWKSFCLVMLLLFLCFYTENVIRITHNKIAVIIIVFYTIQYYNNCCFHVSYANDVHFGAARLFWSWQTTKIGVVDCENGRIFNKQTRKLSFKWGDLWIISSFEIKWVISENNYLKDHGEFLYKFHMKRD